MIFFLKENKITFSIRVSVVFCSMLFLFHSNAISQSTKIIVKQEILSREVWITDLETGDKRYMKSKKTFDSFGNVIEEIDYTIKGKEEKHWKYEYDKKGKNILKELKLDRKRNVLKTIIYTYNEGLKVKKVVLDKNGKEQRVTEYLYQKVNADN